uniref:Uncharacterized protein n=1 Tax=Anopheles gambiae TaxID=7165 RepID=A0A3F2YYV0_ANOGA
MHHTISSLIALAFIPFARCELKPVTTVDESSLKIFQQGIDRICSTSSFSEIYLITNEDLSRVSPYISMFNFNRPVTLRDFRYKGQFQIETCFVAFITSNELSEVVQDHIERFALFIAVLPTDVMETVQNFASMLYKCMMYYFYYDPVTLAGSWTIERGGKRIYTLADFGTGDTAGWNLRGQTVAFLNMDPNRATAHDIEIGQTMAKRHNGTFAMAQGLLQCFDYVYTAIYATSVGSFATLPEMFQMCFLVPKSAPKSVFAILSDPFDYYCWGTFIFTIGTVSVLLSLFGESYRQYNVGLVFLELVMNALNGPSHRFYGRFEVRLVGLFMMMNIVLLSCYQSLIISLMSSARYDPEIDTMEQINDTCQFQRDMFLQSLGYRFKNTIYTYRRYESYEEIWANKICLMVMCSDLSTGHALVETQSNNFDDDIDNNLEQYFRISKARIRSSAVMYSIMNFSPMRTLIHRYTSAYSEGHLHHLPLVKAKKHSSSQPNAHESIVLVTMRPEDLLIVWIIFLIGCGASGAVFLLELSLVWVPKVFRTIRLNASNKLKMVKTSFKKKKGWNV